MMSILLMALTFLMWILVNFNQASETWMLLSLLMAISFRYIMLKNKGVFLSRDPLMIITVLPSIALVLYAAMFSLIEVKSYLDVASQDKNLALYDGCNFLFAMLTGGAIHLALSRDRGRGDSAVAVGLFNKKLLLLFAWAPLVVAFFCYFVFFYGKDYVAVHSNVPILANVLLKTIYFSYPAAYFIASSCSFSEDKRERQVLMLLAGHIIVFSFFYMLRSPAVFFSLMVLFFIGHKMKFKTAVIAAIIAPLALTAIALVRDPTLQDSGLEQSILKLVVTFGDFVDALRFSREYVSANGHGWGLNMLGSFFGFSEPVANLYAKSINEDYFESGGGFGFFILADVFVNFGLILGVVFSIVFGYLLSKLAKANYGTAAGYISCVLFASALSLTRNDFGSTLRGVFYCLIAFLIVRMLTARRVI